MRTIGIDLAISARHKGVVMEEDGSFISPLISFRPRWQEIKQVVDRAREGVEEDHPLQAVMEPTGMAWFTLSVALSRMGVKPIYLVNGRKAHDLRLFYSRHSCSDRISARVLARMVIVDPESLYPLQIPTATQLACRRGCKELDRLQRQMTAIKNRLIETDRFAWPGLEEIFKDSFSARARLFRDKWYEPSFVLSSGEEELRRSFLSVGRGKDLDWVKDLIQLAEDVLKLYGHQMLDYSLLHQEVIRQQRLLSYLEEEEEMVWHDVVRPLYHRLHPSRNLETLCGVGERSAALPLAL